MRDLIYREILEYHPQMLADYLAGGHRQPNFVYPSAGTWIVGASWLREGSILGSSQPCLCGTEGCCGPTASAGLLRLRQPRPHSTTQHPVPRCAAVDNFKRQFAHLEGGGKGPAAHLGQATSLPRERVREFQSEVRGRREGGRAGRDQRGHDGPVAEGSAGGQWRGSWPLGWPFQGGVMGLWLRACG